MAQKKNSPALRFEGFTEDWEEKKFDKVFRNIRNNSLSRDNLNYKSGIAKNVHYGDILVKFGEILDVQKHQLPYVTDDQIAEDLKSSQLINGDIVLADAAEDEIVGKCVEIQNIDKEVVLSGLHTIAVRPTQEFAPKYLGYYMNSISYHDQLVRLMQGTKVLSISKTVIQDTNVRYPSDRTEQSKISEYITEIDELLNKHKKKHDRLVTLKKSMLEKMFPKEGQSVPEIRFKGFEGEWDEKRLGGLCSIITKGTTPLDKSKKGSVSFIKIENIDSISGSINITSKITLEEHENYLQRSQLQIGDILFSIAGTLGRIAIIEEKVLPANTNQALAIIRLTTANIGYISVYLKSQAIKDFIKRSPTIGAQPNLSLEQMNNIIIPLPCVSEQAKVFSYFQNLDTLITKHKKQLEKLSNFKKSLSEKMFV